MDIDDGIEEYLATKQNRITHSTYQWYDRFLHSFLDWTTAHRLMDLSQVQASHVQQFVADAPTKNSHTQHARAQIVKGFLSWCSKDAEMGGKRSTVERIEMPQIVQSEVTLFNEHDISK